MFEYWSSRTGADAGQLAAAVLADGKYRDFERGELTPEQFHRHLTDIMGVKMDFEQFRLGWCKVFEGLYEGTEQLLDDLSSHMRLVALTNTNILHSVLWKQLYADAMRRFEAVFISHEMGARKPEPEIYQPVLDYLAEPPERVVFVDDRGENISAAVRLGMRGILVEDPAEIRESFRQLDVPV